MAANYWESTQRRHWQSTREQLEDLRKKLEDEDQNLVQMYPLAQLRHLSIYFNQRKWYRKYYLWMGGANHSVLQKLVGSQSVLVYDNKLWQRHSYTFAGSIQRSRSDGQIHTWSLQLQYILHARWKNALITSGLS